MKYKIEQSGIFYRAMFKKNIFSKWRCLMGGNKGEHIYTAEIMEDGCFCGWRDERMAEKLIKFHKESCV